MDMYVVVTTQESKTLFFSMLANNGIYTDESILKAVIFNDSTTANKQRDVLNSMGTDVYVTKRVTLANV